ncbi:hypothetical protein SFRURICE_012183 [Spodoptera frugiperda]|nr:hypothetical protein SFRURICE_012183 [Spodoptera frugiperda]
MAMLGQLVNKAIFSTFIVWPSGCKCDRASGLGFDSRIGLRSTISTTRFFRFFEKKTVVARSLELCPVYGNRITPYYMGLITHMVKSGCIAALRATVFCALIGWFICASQSERQTRSRFIFVKRKVNSY